jgi:hypothetical protein
MDFLFETFGGYNCRLNVILTRRLREKEKILDGVSSENNTS